MRSTNPAKQIDPAATRAIILQAATELFALNGFAATSINAIAAKAGVPKSLVLYHFESKEALWQNVFASKGKQMFEVAQAIIDGTPGVTLHDLVIAKFRTLQANPDLVRLMGWMSLEANGPVPQIAERAQRVRDTIRNNPDRFSVSSGIAPEKYLVILMSAVDGYFRFRELYGHMLACPMALPENEDEFITSLLAIAGQTPLENIHGI